MRSLAAAVWSKLLTQIAGPQQNGPPYNFKEATTNPPRIFLSY
jgi:hypothetical protein